MGLCFPFIENTVVFLNQGYRLFWTIYSNANCFDCWVLTLVCL